MVVSSSYKVGCCILKLRDLNQIQLDEVYYVEGIPYNYVAVNKLKEMNFDVLFKKTGKVYLLDESNNVISFGIDRNKDYVVDVLEHKMLNAINNVKSNEKMIVDNMQNSVVAVNYNLIYGKFALPTALTNTQYYHFLFNHPPKILLKYFLKEFMNIAYEPFNCNVCDFIKLKRVCPKEKFTESRHPLDIVYMDIFQINRRTFNGDKYGLMIVDDFTEFKKVYKFKEKSEVTAIVTEIWHKQAERTTGHKLKTIRCDNDLNFTNKKMLTYFTSKGVKIDPTVPYNAHQNGVAERNIQTVKYKADTLVATCSPEIGDLLYGEALKTAAVLQNNMIFSPQNPTTPNDLYGESFSIAKLFRFSEWVNYIYCPSQNLIKGQGIFCGYNGKGYSVYIQEKNCILPVAHLNSVSPIRLVKKNDLNMNLENKEIRLAICHICLDEDLKIKNCNFKENEIKIFEQ